jgi:hypothetical protein
MVGLTTPKSREENRKKSKKAPPLLVSLPRPTALRNIEKNKTNKRELKIPLLPLCWQW